MEDSGQIISITSDYVNNIFTTATHVYKYPLAYAVKSGVTTGTVLTKGFVPVEVVELFDFVGTKNWWDTELSIKPANVRVNIPLQLPPVLMLINTTGNLSFINSVEPVNVSSGGFITFPVNGSPADVLAFRKSISTPEMVSQLFTFIGSPELGNGSSAVINPVDFIFQSFLSKTSALLRVKFTTTDQLASFQEYLSLIKDALPPNILLIILCDLIVGGEVMNLNTEQVNDTVSTAHPSTIHSDLIQFNNTTGPGLTIKDMGFSRVIISELTSADYRNISLIVPS